MSSSDDAGGLPQLSEPPSADLVPAAVFVIQDDTFAYVNPTAAVLLGADAPSLLGRSSLEFVHPDDRASVREWQASVGDEALTGASFPLRISRHDGSERLVLMSSRRVSFRGRAALLGAAVDVTGNPDAVAAPVRMAAVGRLAGGVAHDFNNLLLVISGQVERLQRDLPSDHSLRPAIDAIGTSAERAAILTDQLLSFGRRQVLTPQVTDLTTLLTDMELRFRLLVGPAIRLVIDCAAGVPAIRADRPRLVQVLRHLIDNARDAMPSGGTLRIAVDTVDVDTELAAQRPFLHPGSRFVRLRVADTGHGMDAALVPHVFEPFFTTKGRGRGAGMGLASVYGIVKQSRGYVFVDRTGDDGTGITILLPPVGGPGLAVSPEPNAPRGATRSPRARILLVEDDMAVRELLSDVLTHHDFDVTAAETGEQAALVAEEQSFDVLLTDVDLPGMNGAQLATALRAGAPGLAVVMMSGYPDDDVLADAAPDDRRALLRKPFSTEQLLHRVRAALAAR